MPKPPPESPMSGDEFARLDSLERRIAVAWDEAALALAEIKSAKLYRTTRDGVKQTWDEYCHRVHHWTPQWANTLIKRAKTLHRLRAESESSLSLSPTAVGQLEGLQPQEQAEIVKVATQNGPAPKAKVVADAKYKKLMERVKPVGGEQPEKNAGNTKQRTAFLVTVVTPDKNDLKEFSKLLPSPITDFKAQSVSGWVPPNDLPVALERIGQALAAGQPRKVRVKVEHG